MIVCKRCLYTNLHPLNIVFDANGICSGCRVHEEKDKINWIERREKLASILNHYRCRSGKNYDCIVPVSGARDSFFIVHTLKKVFHLNPLLVTYNKQYNTDIGVRNLAKLRIALDCDLFTLTVSPDSVKKITRATLRQMGSIYWHCLAGQTVFPVKMAVRLKIPLIIWGAHQGIDQVGMYSHFDEVEMTRKYRKEHDLMGYEAEDLINNFDNVREDDVAEFIYPDNLEIEKVGIRGIYLNNYLRWDSRSQHEKMLRLYKYETNKQVRTFDSYNDVDCWNYSDTHDYLKYLKHGFGKVVDHACREIRLHHMTRNQGITLIKKYQAIGPKNLTLFLDWIGMTRNSFFYIVDQHRNKNLWVRDQDFKWKKSKNILKKVYLSKSKKCYLPVWKKFKTFRITQRNTSTDQKNKYILIGKGYS